jgi:hypothetical protein
MLPKERQDLAPVRTLYHVQPGHERFFLFGSPRSPCGLQTFSPRCIGRLGDGGLASLFIEGGGRQGLVWRQDLAGRSRLSCRIRVLGIRLIG